MPCEVPLLFIDQEETTFLRDLNVIKKLPVFCRALSGLGEDWDTQSLDPTDAWDVPFPKCAAVFIFENILKYTLEDGVKHTMDRYPEANRLTMAELRDIMELANFWELLDFMDCLGYVAAKKLEMNDFDQIADFMGARRGLEPELWFREQDGWMHPPIAVFGQH